MKKSRTPEEKSITKTHANKNKIKKIKKELQKNLPEKQRKILEERLDFHKGYK